MPEPARFCCIPADPGWCAPCPPSRCDRSASSSWPLHAEKSMSCLPCRTSEALVAMVCDAPEITAFFMNQRHQGHQQQNEPRQRDKAAVHHLIPFGLGDGGADILEQHRMVPSIGLGSSVAMVAFGLIGFMGLAMGQEAFCRPIFRTCPSPPLPVRPWVRPAQETSGIAQETGPDVLAQSLRGWSNRSHCP